MGFKTESMNTEFLKMKSCIGDAIVTKFDMANIGKVEKTKETFKVFLQGALFASNFLVEMDENLRDDVDISEALLDFDRCLNYIFDNGKPREGLAEVLLDDILEGTL